MQAGIHFGVAIRAIHYPVSVGYTIRRFSRRNNADISTLASPSPIRGWPGWPKRRWFRGVSDNIFLRHEGTRHTPILFLSVLSLPPTSPFLSLSLSSTRRDGWNNSFRECVPASEAVDSSHVWDTWQRVNNVAGGPVRLALYFESRMDGRIVNQSVGWSYPRFHEHVVYLPSRTKRNLSILISNITDCFQ